MRVVCTTVGILFVLLLLGCGREVDGRAAGLDDVRSDGPRPVVARLGTCWALRSEVPRLADGLGMERLAPLWCERDICEVQLPATLAVPISNTPDGGPPSPPVRCPL